MIKNNFFGTVLVSLLILLLLIASFQMLGFGNDIKQIQKPDDINESLPKIKINNSDAVDSSLDKTKELMEGIQARPMFSSSRTPYLEPEIEVVIEDPPLEINELKAKLTAVVITSDNRYVMIHDELTNEKLIYKEGMPLEGEQGGWSLTEISPRKVLFTSEDNKTQELELEVFAAKGGASKASQSRTTSQANKADKEKQAKIEKKKTADDIRKKIAERRAKMRAEALQKQ